MVGNINKLSHKIKLIGFFERCSENSDDTCTLDFMRWIYKFHAFDIFF